MNTIQTYLKEREERLGKELRPLFVPLIREDTIPFLQRNIDEYNRETLQNCLKMVREEIDKTFLPHINRSPFDYKLGSVDREEQIVDLIQSLEESITSNKD